jgi:hypothetical protein
MEEEEKAAQSAKLQELIRRGGPEDLQEANRLMKIMAGYDTRQKTDYRAKAAEEVGKVQQKARLLEERLEEFKPGDTMTEGDVYEELASALQSAHPKIQKMCEEESDDHEAVAKLLEINDSIHRTVERYKLMKKGDVESASKIAKGTLGTSTGVAKNSDNELSLIDFGGDVEPNGSSSSAAPAPAQQSQPGGLEDDLLGLSMGESYGQGGGISLGFGNNTSKFELRLEFGNFANDDRYSGSCVNILNDGTQYGKGTYSHQISGSVTATTCQARLFCLFCVWICRSSSKTCHPTANIIPTATSSRCCTKTSTPSSTIRSLCSSDFPNPTINATASSTIHVRFWEPPSTSTCSCSSSR